MENDDAPPPAFRHSFALIDAEGRLVDWDSGLEQEWAHAALLLRRGTSYGDIVRVLTAGDQGRAFIEAKFGPRDVDVSIQRWIDGLGKDRSHEYRSVTGRVVYVEERVTASGGVQRTARDVTEERQAQEALAEARRKLKAADPDSTGAFVEIRRNPDGSYVFPPVTKGMVRLLDLPAAFVGADPMALHTRMKVSLEETARMSTALEHSARTLTQCSFELCIRDGNDRLRWLRESLMPRREADGTVVFTGVMRDITREKEVEDQVELLRSVVVRSSDAIMISQTGAPPELATKILYVNPAFERLFGVPADRLVGQSAQDIAFGGVDPSKAKLLCGALVDGDGTPIEFEAYAASGVSFWVEARTELVQKFDNGSYRWVVIARDITERRRAQMDLLLAKDTAEAANRTKGMFLASMSHELKNALNAIIGFSELIEQGVERGGWIQTYAEYLQDISASGRHLLSLINSILDLSKIESGILDLTVEPVDLDELIQASIALVSGMATSGEVRLVFGRDMASGRPAQSAANGVTQEAASGPAARGAAAAGVTQSTASGRVELNGDFLKLKQVLLNVLSNAIKFTPAGGAIGVTAEIGDAAVAIVVSDTGCGMSEADLQQVGMPFVTIENSLSRKYPGTGLGLSIAKQICELHRGTLEICSVEGKGTIVRITLPRAAAQGEKAAESPLESPVASRPRLSSVG